MMAGSGRSSSLSWETWEWAPSVKAVWEDVQYTVTCGQWLK